MPNLIGKVLSGRYRVDELLGQGGMAEVYKVWDLERAAYLALKLLREDLAQDVVFLRRFRREASSLDRLQHPNIVRFYGLEQDDLLAFILMDYIAGSSLRTKIFQSREVGMDSQEILEYMSGICSALHFAHRSGTVHCDLKPGNVLIDEKGNPLVTDFGIARLTDAATATMVGIGTPAYMAPEQVKGQDPVPQTDIYSLGVTLFEMLAGGERPFTGEAATTTGTTSAKVRWEQVNLDPPSLKEYNPEISPELEAVVLKCLEKKPRDRFQTPLDLLNALEYVVGVEIRSETIVEQVVEQEPPIKKDRSSRAQEQGTGPAEVNLSNPQQNNVHSSHSPTRNWFQRWGGWITTGGILLAVLAVLFIGGGNFPLLPKPSETPQPTKTSTLVPSPTNTNTPTSTAVPSPTQTLAPVLGIGSTQVSTVDGMVQLYIPQGEYLMGSTEKENNMLVEFCTGNFILGYVNSIRLNTKNCEDLHSDELPQHTVAIDAFWMDQNEVTLSQFKEFMDNENYLSDPCGKGEDHPVSCVNWHGAEAYCEWVGRRLPTEAEWEKASRGGLIGELYPWGNEFPVCDFSSENGSQSSSCDYSTVTIMSFSPNGYGLYDMSGNVREWVSDWYSKTYYKISPTENPKGPEGGYLRVLRGGSMWYGDLSVRNAAREYAKPDSIWRGQGFRCAESIP